MNCLSQQVTLLFQRYQRDEFKTRNKTFDLQYHLANLGGITTVLVDCIANVVVYPSQISLNMYVRVWLN